MTTSSRKWKDGVVEQAVEKQIGTEDSSGSEEIYQGGDDNDNKQ